MYLLLIHLLVASGYDFGYLLKLLTCTSMPADESEFFEILRIYFPCIYDIKYLMRSCKNLKGGLQDIADDLQVSWVYVYIYHDWLTSIIHSRLHESVPNIKLAVIVYSHALHSSKCGKCSLMIGLMIRNICKWRRRRREESYYHAS